MKRILLLCLLSILIMSGSSFTPSQKHVSLKVKDCTGNETIDVYAGPGIGAHEVAIYVSRTGPDAGMCTVSFDVDLMIDYIPEHVQTYHIEVPGGYTSWYGYYYCNWIVGTDATVVGSIYNVTYN